MAVVKNVNGEIVKVVKTSNKGDMKGYCGQKIQDNIYAVYVPTLGICSVKKADEKETVIITGILTPIEKIKEKILNDFKKGKKLAVMIESISDQNILEVLEIPVNKTTINTIMEGLSLNTTGKKFGVCIRNVSDNINKLAGIGHTVLSFPSDTLGNIASEFATSGANNGNFAEYLLSGNKKDIENRFREKKNDVYVKLDAFKSIRRWELKTSLKYINKSKKSGASNTNMLYHENIVK